MLVDAKKYPAWDEGEALASNAAGDASRAYDRSTGQFNRTLLLTSPNATSGSSQADLPPSMYIRGRDIIRPSHVSALRLKSDDYDIDRGIGFGFADAIHREPTELRDHM